jgi:hypothetical protein
MATRPCIACRLGKLLGVSGAFRLGLPASHDREAARRKAADEAKLVAAAALLAPHAGRGRGERG